MTTGTRAVKRGSLCASLLITALATALTAGVNGSSAAGHEATANRTRHVMPFRGLGSWVDLYDTAAWADPDGTVASIQRHGVRTVYLETSNFSAPSAIVSPSAVSRFIVASHGAGMRIVAWYLPSLQQPSTDLARSLAAIQFRTADGQAFDGFGLDIESTSVTDPVVRTARLLALSESLRASAGAGYPLGAIVPAPAAMQDRPDYWPGFPFRKLAQTFDAFLPMGYYTYHVTTAREAHDYTARNISLLRRWSGNPTVPIHVIGGLAGDSSDSEVRAFVHAARENGVLGASLYDGATTSASQWQLLAPVPVNPVERPALPAPLPFAGVLGNVPGADRRHPKEAFFTTGALSGSYRLRFRVYDVQPDEVQLWVNWHYVRTLNPSSGQTWSTLRTAAIPSNLLHGSRPNVIQFVASGNWPDWSVWGVRDVRLAAVS